MTSIRKEKKLLKFGLMRLIKTKEEYMRISVNSPMIDAVNRLIDMHIEAISDIKIIRKK